MTSQQAKCERSKLRLCCAIGAVLLVIGLPSTANAAQRGPTAWWPDPATGLMWANLPAGGWFKWDQATSYCASLSLGGYKGWRLPTLDEAKISTTSETFYPIATHAPPIKHSAIAHNPGGVSSDPYTDTLIKGVIDAGEGTLWTSTKAGDWAAWAISSGTITTEDIGKSWYYEALCVRTMEPDLLQLAKAAQVRSPVPDVLTLRGYVSLTQARASFVAGQYQAAITQANSALALDPQYAPAFWALGVCYGVLGQWDQAVNNLQSAVKIDKNYNHGKAALKWAQENRTAAKKGYGRKGTIPYWE